MPPGSTKGPAWLLPGGVLLFHPAQIGAAVALAAASFIFPIVSSRSKLPSFPSTSSYGIPILFETSRPLEASHGSDAPS